MKQPRPKVPWEVVYEIKEDFVSLDFGDVDCYVIYNKLSDTYHQEWMNHHGKVGTWFSYSIEDAKRKAKSIYLKDQKAIEKALLK